MTMPYLPRRGGGCSRSSANKQSIQMMDASAYDVLLLVSAKLKNDSGVCLPVGISTNLRRRSSVDTDQRKIYSCSL